LLQFLAPQFAETRVEFVNLDALTLEYDRIERHPRQSTYATGLAARLLRIAFESLDDYATKENRNVQTIPENLLQEEVLALEEVIDVASGDASPWRTPLNEALDPDRAPAIRTSLLATLLQGQYTPDHDFSYVRSGFADYMDAVGRVLAHRLDDDRAIKEWESDVVPDLDLKSDAP
jgi:hypothetical protein